jgi:hypothetical protein
MVRMYKMGKNWTGDNTIKCIFRDCNNAVRFTNKDNSERIWTVCGNHYWLIVEINTEWKQYTKEEFLETKLNDIY